MRWRRFVVWCPLLLALTVAGPRLRSDDVPCAMGFDELGTRVRGTNGWFYLTPNKRQYRIADDDPFWRKPRAIKVGSISTTELREEGLPESCLDATTILANRKLAALILDADGVPRGQQRVEVPWPGAEDDFVRTFWRVDVCTGDGHDVVLTGKGRNPRYIYAHGSEGQMIPVLIEGKLQEDAGRVTGLALRLAEKLKETGFKKVHETRCIYTAQGKLMLEVWITNQGNQKEWISLEVH